MCGGINFSSVSMIFPLDFGTVLTGNFFRFFILLFMFIILILIQVAHASFRSKFNNTDQ